MTVLMGVLMGFLAFFVVGGLSGVFAWIFYPGKRSGKPKVKKFLTAIFLGFLASILASYAGQMTGLFQAGQILEWLSAIVAASLAGSLYALVLK